MKISDHQALALFMIARDSCKLADTCIIMGGIERENRLALVNAILKQQDNIPTERGEEDDGVGNN